MFVVEEAKSSDIESLIDLLALLFSQEAEFAPKRDLQRAGLSMILEDASIGTLLVLKKDETVIGMVSLLLSISTALGGKVAFLEDMIVTPLWQGKGGGTMLVKHAIAYAQKCSCKRITLLTDASNHAAHRFYRQLGFKNSLMQPMRFLFTDV